MATSSSYSTAPTHFRRREVLGHAQSKKISGLIGFGSRRISSSRLLLSRPGNFLRDRRIFRVQNVSSESKQKLQDPVTQSDEGLTFLIN